MCPLLAGHGAVWKFGAKLLIPPAREVGEVKGKNEDRARR